MRSGRYEIACMAGTWKLWAQERTGHVRETCKGRGGVCPRRPMKIVSTRFLRVQKIVISQEAPEGISVCVR